MSMNSSAWRRSSSATMEGCVTFVETTETRTPFLRCTASTRERKSPSPEKSDEMVDVVGHFHGVHGQLDVHTSLDLAPAEGIHKLLCRLGQHHGEAIIIQPIDERPYRGLFLIVHQGSIVECPD